MLQIAHDVAPAASCASPRRSAACSTSPTTSARCAKKGTCGADVVVDDVTYFEEPYLLRLRRSPTRSTTSPPRAPTTSPPPATPAEQQSWNSEVRLVPTREGRQGHQPRLQRRRPGAVRRRAAGHEPGHGHRRRAGARPRRGRRHPDLQWDDPVDVDGATLGDPLFTRDRRDHRGRTRRRRSPSPPTADQVGKKVQFRTDAIPSGTTDLILTVTGAGRHRTSASRHRLLAGAARHQADPGRCLHDHDHRVRRRRPATSRWRSGRCPLRRRSPTDFNLLLFDGDGTFLGAIADLNPLSGRPHRRSRTSTGSPTSRS